MDFFIPAIGIGILLSLVLIGPVFFLLIETSLLKGWKAALVLNFGVISADILCIVISYFSSRDLGQYIETHPALFRIGGFVVLIYGLVMMFSKPKLHINNSAVVTTNYFKTFFNGFLLNMLNIGVIIFWFTIVSSIAIKYPSPDKFIFFIGTVLVTFFSIDLLKIFLAQKFNSKLTDDRVYFIRKVLGIILVIFGIILFLKSYGVLDEIDGKIEQKLQIKEKLK